jgi:hypothetical protein
MAGDRKGDIDNHGIAKNERDVPDGVIERARGGMRERGGQAGPNIGGSGVHGLQDPVNRGGPSTKPSAEDADDER